MRHEGNKGNVYPSLQGSPEKVSVHQKCHGSGEISMYDTQGSDSKQMPEQEQSMTLLHDTVVYLLVECLALRTPSPA